MRYILVNQDGLYYSVNKEVTLDYKNAQIYEYKTEAENAILDMHDQSGDWFVKATNFSVADKISYF